MDFRPARHRLSGAVALTCAFVLAGTNVFAADKKSATPVAAKVAPKSTAAPMQFSADKYIRDLRTGQTIGEGHVRIVTGTRVVEADRIEYDTHTMLATARGNVRFSDGPPVNLRGTASNAEISLSQPEATFEDATLTTGTMVFSGKRLRRIDRDNFVIEDGTYSNCNLDQLGPEEAAGCSMDWRIVGKKISVELGGYAHVEGTMLFLRNMPMLYLPYAIFPAKTERQTGLLSPRFINTAAVGSGFSLPFFWAINAWQDLTFTPTWFSAAGAHLEANYRYRYSAETFGDFSIFTSQRSYGQDPDKPYPSLSNVRGVGIGEVGFRARNSVAFEGRTYTRQDIHWVTNPFYTLDFPGFTAEANLSYQRSQIAYVAPGNTFLLAVNTQQYQSLLVSKDRGVDQGPVTELPTVFLTAAGVEVWDRYLTAETDVRLSYFYRPEAYDAIPADPLAMGNNAEAARGFAPTDFLRTGFRMYLEPRMVATIPLPEGLQLQPTFKLGALAYVFPEEAPGNTARVFGELEVPISMYLQRAFKSETSEDFASLSHSIQPRLSLVTRRFFTPTPPHPFFQPEAPRFDVYDFLTDTDSMRVELIQRLRRRTRSGGTHRVAWLQLGQNIALSGPRPLGPVEILADFNYAAFSLQLQGQLRPDLVARMAPAGEVREYDLSSTIVYNDGVDRADLTAVFRQRANPALDARSLIASFTKTLPTFFDVRASAEYSLLHEELRGFSLGLIFRSKPMSCWELSFTTGRNAYKQGFTNIGFQFDFGGTGSGVPRTN